MLKVTRLLISLSFTALLIIPFYTEAQELADESFADFLFREGEYYRAIIEYYRLLHSDLDQPGRTKLLQKVGWCYFKGADYEGYVLFYRRYRDSFPPDSLHYGEMNLLLGKSYYHMGLYQKAISGLDSLQWSPSNHFFNEKQFLSGISYGRLYNWPAAIRELEEIGQGHSDSDRIVAENMIRAFRNFPDLSSRSPYLAGGLSAIIPGAGYAYCQRWGTGIASLLVNGLLIWTFTDALKQDQYGLASLTGFVGVGWYVGNIKGSVKAAQKYNSSIRDDFINSVLQRENFLEYVKN